MFKFRLQRVLELREEHEQAKARVLATAQDAADEARRQQESLAAVRANSRAEVEAAHSEAPRVGHLHQLGFVLQSLDQRLLVATETVLTAEHVVQQAQGALTEAARDRRVLDRLKERHAEVWRAEEAQKDRLLMDEIALSRFSQKADTASADSSAGNTTESRTDSKTS